jgi:hypothetical protein
MSTDRTRQAFLVHSLAEIATQRHQLSLEIATIQEMKRELAVKIRTQVLKTAFAPLSSDNRFDQRPTISAPGAVYGSLH